MPKTKHSSFNTFLQELFMEDYHGDKDHFEAAYDVWLEQIGFDTLLQWADRFGDIVFKEGQIAYADKLLTNN